MILLFALLNLLRGRGILPGGRIVACAGMGLAAGWCLGLAHGAVIGLGCYLWALPGWGNGFLSITGRDQRDYAENPWLCKLADRLCGVTPLDALDSRAAKRWGFWYMSLRGLYLYPTFVVLSFWNPWAAVIGLGCLLQGTCYRLSGAWGEKTLSVALAEFLFGAVIGAMLVMV